MSEEIVLTYGRVSSLKQKDNFSTGTQLLMMREECENRGWEIYAELAEVGSAWAEGLERSELKKALELARAKKITMLMFFSADRFTRNVADGAMLRERLRQYGIKLFCFYPVPIEINSQQEVMHILNDWQSQQVVQIQRDKAVSAVRSKVLMGLYPQGNTPYGYILEGKKRETVVKIDEDKVGIVEEIFDLYYYHNIGATAIADILNKRKVPAPRGKVGNWKHSTIRKILNNEAYAGIWYATQSHQRLQLEKKACNSSSSPGYYNNGTDSKPLR